MTSEELDGLDSQSVSDSVSAQSLETSLVWTPQTVALSILLFIAAGLLEVGGGWLVWQTIREDKNWTYAAAGVIALIGYGFVPCLQPTSDFGRVYAIYGGFFIVLAFAWARQFDGYLPDMGDLVGAGIALSGVLVIMLWPR
ncbi:YnfA family protein [Synechococcus sp. UW179A]|uniref:YnfA family protein n=1 Tax=Synechococcus sp. UW179A TaxID=2575510 RepID=UPI001FCBB5BB|nr:YnfA family protein [Synechococcus sp. UW179A]